MTDDIDELIRDTLTPKDKLPPTDAFRAVAEAAMLREREKWENHRLILMEKQYVLNEKLILDARREFALELLTDNGSIHWHEKHRGEVVCVDQRWLREQAGEEA